MGDWRSFRADGRILTILIKVVRIPNMKIELISPAVEENAPLPNLALPILASLTPPDVEISITDDLLTPIHSERDLKEVDLVGITVLTKTALRAYRIAEAYQKEGIPVVLGGIHPTALPEEAGKHADSVVIGEAEEIWPHLVEDARMRRLKPLYRAQGFTDPSKIPRPRREILPGKDISPSMSFRFPGDVPFTASSARSGIFSETPTGSDRWHRLSMKSKPFGTA